jgi:hypothetical protein
MISLLLLGIEIILLLVHVSVVIHVIVDIAVCVAFTIV